MIVTLTLNPAIDRTVTINTVALGETNRLEEVRRDASGKGINVSRALAKQGISSVAMGYLAGTEGEFIATTLEKYNIETKFTWIRQGSTRLNTKIYEKATKRTTELNEPGPLVQAKDTENLWRYLESILPKTSFLICSGSLPRGVDTSFYYDLIKKCNQLGVKVFFDSSGTALTQGVKASPYFIKPNQDEAKTLLKRAIGDKSAMKATLEELAKLAIPFIVLSLGEDGAIFYSDQKPLLWAKAPAEQLGSTSGCGDALVAAFVASLLQNKSWEDIVRWSIATATATAELSGTTFPDKEHIKRVLPRVLVEDM